MSLRNVSRDVLHIDTARHTTGHATTQTRRWNGWMTWSTVNSPRLRGGRFM